jgi:hypothetical protein
MSGASRHGPHPDLLAQAISLLNRSHADATKQGHALPSLASARLEVIGQITNPEVDSPIFGRRAESAWLARIRLEDGDELVLAAGACAPGESEWHIEQLSTAGVAPVEMSMPFDFASSLGAPGRYIVGAVVNTPDLAGLRLILADGTTFEAEVADGWVLLFAAFSSPDQWADWARLQFIDRTGRVVREEKQWVHPDKMPPEWEK